MPPRVSFCLPNLNNRRFLDRRIESILGQTFADWELIICDGYSDDGSWELFADLAARDSRVQAFQAPRDGIYPAWNRCIEQASGEFIYIATSDDDCAPDCIEKLVAALETHAGCDLACCPLRVIDEEGRMEPGWWERHSLLARSSGAWLGRLHLRRAPLDGILQMLGESVHISLTQVLIRRRLFDRIGVFPLRWGSVGDFFWMMRAGLVADAVFVPDTWGGWRIHAGQATSAVNASRKKAAVIDAMIEEAIEVSREDLEPEVRGFLDERWRKRLAEARVFFRAMAAEARIGARRWRLLENLVRGRWVARLDCWQRLRRGPTAERRLPALLVAEIERAVGRRLIEPAQEVAPRP